MEEQDYLEEDAEPTKVDLNPVSTVITGQDLQKSEADPPNDPRSSLTPIEVAELQTQIQYRLIEQLNEAREANQELKKALESQENSAPDEGAE